MILDTCQSNQVITWLDQEQFAGLQVILPTVYAAPLDTVSNANMFTKFNNVKCAPPEYSSRNIR